MSAPRSDGSILHVDFEQVSDTLVTARNAGVILDYQTGARIVDGFAYKGRRCAHIAVAEPGRTAQVRLVPAWDAPGAGDGAVLELVFRPVIEGSVDLVDWPIVRCSTRGEGLEQAQPVGLELRARGAAGEGTYEVDVISDKAIVSTAVKGLPQAGWTRFVMHRQDGLVALYAGPPGEEAEIAAFPDLGLDEELYCICLGNAGSPDSQGSGYWDAVRLGKVRLGGVAPAERRVVHVGEAAPVPPDTLAVGREKQLLIDDWAIAGCRSVQRVFHRPQKHPENPLVIPEKPWEGRAIYLFGGVERQEDGRFRMWYYAADPTPENRKNAHTCLALSEDGIRWEKPELGICEYGGMRENNIVIAESGPYSLIADPEDERPDFRYKTHLRYGGTTGWSSPDGLRWTCRGVILPQSLDATSVHLDPVTRKYMASVKIGYKGRRYRGYAESGDFLHWSDTYPMMDVDELDDFGDQVYAMKIFRYESLYLGLAKIYHVERDDTCDIQLAVSRNGRRWERPFRALRPPEFAERDREIGPLPDGPHAQPFLPTGPAGSWEYGNHDTAGTPPVRVGDELWFYYSGRARSHGGSLPEGVEWDGPLGAIGLATLRVDGFVGARAAREGGWVLTRPLALEGKDLYVNVDAEGGEVVVEVLDAEGRTVSRSSPLREDGTRLRCTWEGESDIEAFAGKAVRLRFQLTGAELYAFWCE